MLKAYSFVIKTSSGFRAEISKFKVFLKRYEAILFRKFGFGLLYRPAK